MNIWKLALVGGVSAALALGPASASPPFVPGAPQNGFSYDSVNQRFNGPNTGSLLFRGSDGTPQGGIGYTGGAAEYPILLGGATGAGGTILCTNILVTGNVTCNITAYGTGAVKINNGHGGLLNVVDPGAAVSATVTVTPGTAGTEADISAGGGPVTIGGSPVTRVQDMTQPWAMNINPDFVFDQLNNAQLVSPTSGLVADAWRVSASQSGKLSFQRVAGQFPNFAFEEKIIAAAGAYSALSGDSFTLKTSISGGDFGQLNWGTALGTAPTPFTVRFCISTGGGFTLPFTLPIAFNNANHGSSYRSYVTTVNVQYNYGCYALTVPVDATPSSWQGGAPPNTVALNAIIDLGSGSSAQSPAANTWEAGNYTTVSGAGSVVGQPASAYFDVAAFHIYPGSWQSAPYSPLPYASEFGRDRAVVFSTFQIGTTPAQNVGASTGELTFTAHVAGTATNRVTMPINPPLFKNSAGGSSVTFYNPAAANANCRDETIGADGGAATLVALSQYYMTFTCTGNTSTVAGDQMGVHVFIDSGM